MTLAWHFSLCWVLWRYSLANSLAHGWAKYHFHCIYSNALVKCDRCVDTFMTLHVFGAAVATCWQRVFLVELKRNLGPIAASGFIFGVVSPSSVAAWKVRGWLIHVDPNLIDIFFMASTLHINDRHRLLYKLLFSILMYIYIYTHKFAGQDS